MPEGILFSTTVVNNGALRTFTVELPTLRCDAGTVVIAINGERHNAYPTETAAYDQLRRWEVIGYDPR